MSSMDSPNSERDRRVFDGSLVAFVVIAALMALLVIAWARIFDTNVSVPFAGVGDDR